MTNLELLRPKVMNAEVERRNLADERRKKLARIGWRILAFAFTCVLVYGAARAIDLGY